eukprot:SAG11_NODE_2917_length_2839_cov_1.643431_2_plen_189_part_00
MLAHLGASRQISQTVASTPPCAVLAACAPAGSVGQVIQVGIAAAGRRTCRQYQFRSIRSIESMLDLRQLQPLLSPHSRRVLQEGQLLALQGRLRWWDHTLLSGMQQQLISLYITNRRCSEQHGAVLPTAASTPSVVAISAQKLQLEPLANSNTIRVSPLDGCLLGVPPNSVFSMPVVSGHLAAVFAAL